MAVFLVFLTVDGYQIEAYTGIIPQVDQLAFYGIFYFIGYILQKNPKSLQLRLKGIWFYFVFGSMLTVLISYFKLGNVDVSPYLAKFISAFATVTLTIGLLGLFVRYFKFENKIIRYLSDSSYWIYLVHLPIIVIIQTVMIEYDVHFVAKFLFNLSLTTFISLITYHLYVRYTIIGTVLHGPRIKNYSKYVFTK